MHPKTCPLAGLAQCLQESSPVFVCLKDRLSPIPPTHHVVHRAGIFNPKGPWHARILQSPHHTSTPFCYYVRTDPFSFLTMQKDLPPLGRVGSEIGGANLSA